MPKTIQQPPTSQAKFNLEYEHGTHKAFFRYYAEQNLERRTYERFLALREMILRQRSLRKAGALDVADIGCRVGTMSQL